MPFISNQYRGYVRYKKLIKEKKTNHTYNKTINNQNHYLLLPNTENNV